MSVPDRAAAGPAAAPGRTRRTPCRPPGSRTPRCRSPPRPAAPRASRRTSSASAIQVRPTARSGTASRSRGRRTQVGRTVMRAIGWPRRPASQASPASGPMYRWIDASYSGDTSSRWSVSAVAAEEQGLERERLLVVDRDRHPRVDRERLELGRPHRGTHHHGLSRPVEPDGDHPRSPVRPGVGRVAPSASTPAAPAPPGRPAGRGRTALRSSSGSLPWDPAGTGPVSTIVLRTRAVQVGPSAPVRAYREGMREPWAMRRDPAAAAHPRVGDRRRPGHARPLRPAPGHLRRLHRQRARADLHRGLHPRRGAPALRQHPHRVQRHRAADDPAARGRPADHPGRRRR